MKKLDIIYNVYKTSWNKIITPDTIILFLLIIFTILVRLLTLQMIGTGSDEVWNWFSAKKLFYGFPYNSWNHHTARFGIIIPVFLVQKVFGTHPVVYYIPTLIMSILLTFFLYKIGTKVHSRRAAFFSCIFLILFPQMVNAGSQILPGGFSYGEFQVEYRAPYPQQLFLHIYPVR